MQRTDQHSIMSCPFWSKLSTSTTMLVTSLYDHTQNMYATSAIVINTDFFVASFLFNKLNYYTIDLTIDIYHVYRLTLYHVF